MESLFKYFITATVFIVLIYSLIVEVEQTITLRKTNAGLTFKHKRALIGHYIASISLLGFANDIDIKSNRK